MWIEDVATGEWQRFFADWNIRVGQEVVIDGRRWRVVSDVLSAGLEAHREFE